MLIKLYEQKVDQWLPGHRAGEGQGRGEGRCYTKGLRKPEVMPFQMYTHVNTLPIVYFKHVQFIAYQLNCNNT